MSEDYEVAQVEVLNDHQMSLSERAAVDIQVSTAKAYPRDIVKATKTSEALVTMSHATAESCSYALPRGNKSITGPSVHLAKILAQNYGNMRAEAKVVEITETQVVSRGTAWDLENNYAVAFEVRRSIVGKDGKKYSDDMITVTGNAANAIAYRNAVLSVIPGGMTDVVYKAAQNFIVGDISTKEKLATRRRAAIDYFKTQYGITQDEVIKLAGKMTIEQIDANAIAMLIGIQQSLKDGDTSVTLLMKDIRESDLGAKKQKLKTNKGKAPDMM